MERWDMEEGRSNTPPPFRLVKFQLGNEVKKYDSVDCLMDRIDNELGHLQLQIPSQRTRATHRPFHRTRSLTRYSDRMKRSKRSATCRSLSKENSCSDSGLPISLSTSQPSLATDVLLRDSLATPLPGLTTVSKDTHLSKSSYGRGGKYGESPLSKQTASSGTSADALSHPAYSGHMNTHLPPLFSEQDLQLSDLLGNQLSPTDSADDLQRLDGASVDTPRTEDFEAAFQANLVTQVAGVTVSNFPAADSDSEPVNAEFVQRKLRQRGTGLEDFFSSTAADTVDEMSDLDQDKDRTMLASYQTTGSGQHYDASSESEIDRDMAREIREESLRIQKEIELERKANRIRDTTPTSREINTRGVRSMTRDRSTNSRETTPNSRDTTPKRPERHYSSSSKDATGPSTGATSTTLSQMSVPSLASSRSTKISLSGPQAEDGQLMERLNNEKLKLLGEISDLQNSLSRVGQELSATEQQVKESRVRAEEARSQMMLAEFKKDAALKEFTQLSSELDRGRQLQATIKMESAQRTPLSSQSSSINLGLSHAELSDLLSERDQLRAIVESRSSSQQLEKNELELQLEATKQELFSEQRKNRESAEVKEGKLEDLASRLSQVTTEKETRSLELESFRAKNHKLEQNIRELDKSKLQAIMERDKELEILKETSQREMLETKMRLNNDLNNAKKLMKISEEKCLKLQLEIQHREELNQDLREECTILQSRTADEEESHDQMLRGMTRKLAAMQEQKVGDMDVLKAQMELEHFSMLERTSADLERQHQEVIGALKEDYDSQLSQEQQLINGKEEEICLLRSRLAQQEEASRKLAERLKADTKHQLEQAVQNERHMWEKEHKYLEGAQVKNVREEAEKQQEQLREQVENEERRCRQLEDQYRTLKSELEEQRHQNQKLYEEKLAAASKYKQTAQEESNLQLEKIRQQLEEDTERVLDKLRSELMLKDDEIRALRNECGSLHQQESETRIALEKLEKLLVSEINDECRKTAHLLGVTPRKAQSSGLIRSGSPSRSKNHRRSRSSTASAIANLRACNEELRNSLKEAKEDVDSLNSALYKTKKSKETEVEEIRKQICRDKGHDMDDLRVRLTQVSNGRSKLSSAYDDVNSSNQYLSRLERKLSDNTLRRSLKDSAPKTNGSRDYNDDLVVDDLGASPQLRRGVQDRLRQLHTRSSSSRKHTSLSTPDLSLSHTDGPSSAMEQRVKLAELKAHLAEERAARNQAMLNHKLQEVNQLQHTLNSQTKEIISLERSFEELKQASFSPPGLASHLSMVP